MQTPGTELRRRRLPRWPERTAPSGPSPDLLAAARGIPPGGDATALHDGKERPGVPRLVVTEGPRKGSEFALVAPLTTIGRALGNTVCVPDVSMSRQHSRLEQHGSAWLVFDQGSGNGTCVNGKPARRRRLRHGDEIAMGDTVVRFVEPFGVLVRAPAPPQPPPGPWLRGRVLVHVAVAVALLTVSGALLIRQRRAAALAEARARTKAERTLAQARFREGIALVKQGLWVEGRAKLRVAAELARDAEITRQLEVAEMEVPRAEALAAARSALRRHDFKGAREALAQIPSDSALADEARLLDSALPPLAARQAQDSTGHAARTPALAHEREEVRAILDAYRRGDLSTASNRARASRSGAARRLAALLERFTTAWRAGLADPDPAAGVRWLDTAADAGRAIDPGRRGRIARALGAALVGRHLALADALPGDDDLPRAAAHLRAAAQADPSNAEAGRRLRQLSLQAKEVYLRAYAAREENPEQARRAFRAVAESLPAGDELGQKARRWLSGLDRKVAE